MFDFIKRFVNRNHETQEETREYVPGCMWCSSFSNGGCRVTGAVFPQWFNAASRPESCPKIDAEIVIK